MNDISLIGTHVKAPMLVCGAIMAVFTTKTVLYRVYSVSDKKWVEVFGGNQLIKIKK